MFDCKPDGEVIETFDARGRSEGAGMQALFSRAVRWRTRKDRSPKARRP